AVSPVGFAFDSRGRTPAYGAGSIHAQHVVGILVVTAGNLTVRQKSALAIRVKVTHLEVIVDVAAFRGDGAASHSHAAGRSDVVHRPGNLVGAVYGLFYDT